MMYSCNDYSVYHTTYLFALVTLEYASALCNFNYFSVSVVNYIYCEIATVLTSYMNIFVVMNVKPL
jgi:hypothetical protein